MKKKIVKISVLFLVIILAVTLFANFSVYVVGKKFIKTDIEDLQEAEVVIALGARVYINGNMSDVFRDRVDTALEVYESGRAKKILISGDHGRKEYDEVSTAKDYLLEKGVKEEDIFLDHAGFDTYDSLYRAGYIFEIKKAIISTQGSHLPRSLYLGRGLGLDVVGIRADKHVYIDSLRQFARERLANVKAFLNLVLRSKPKFLGETINIAGDGRRSWN